MAVVQRILHTLDFELGLTPRVLFRELQIGRATHVLPDQLWRLDPGDCFAAFPVGHGSARQVLNPRDREPRVAAYLWLLLHADEALMIDRLDGALLVDAWPDLAPHLPEGLREAWRPLIDQALDGWWISQLRAGRPKKPKPVSAKARARALRRLAELGLTEDEIRAVLNKRRG